MAGEDRDLSLALSQAKKGDRVALGNLVRAIGGLVYRLSLRMLWHPEDAEDASQEILIKVVTKLGSFRGKSDFTTWVYRIALNHLKSLRAATQRERRNFPAFAQGLVEGLGNDPSASYEGVEAPLLAEEMRIGCLNGMLQCLDESARIAYILGDILGLVGREASAVQSISEEVHRKRLSRARRKLFDFMEAHCGIANPSRPCRCERQIEHCIATERIEPRHLLFALDGQGRALLGRIDSAEQTLRLYRSDPHYDLPARAISGLERIFFEGGMRAG